MKKIAYTLYLTLIALCISQLSWSMNNDSPYIAEEYERLSPIPHLDDDVASIFDMRSPVSECGSDLGDAVDYQDMDSTIPSSTRFQLLKQLLQPQNIKEPLRAQELPLVSPYVAAFFKKIYPRETLARAIKRSTSYAASTLPEPLNSAPILDNSLSKQTAPYTTDKAEELTRNFNQLSISQTAAPAFTVYESPAEEFCQETQEPLIQPTDPKENHAQPGTRTAAKKSAAELSDYEKNVRKIITAFNMQYPNKAVHIGKPTKIKQPHHIPAPCQLSYDEQEWAQHIKILRTIR